MNVRLRTAAALLALPALPLGLAACSNGDQGAQSSTPSAAASSAAQGNDPFAAQPGAQVDKNAFLQQTQDAMRAKKTYHMNMTMTTQGQTMKMAGDGDVSDPNATKVKMTMEVPGQSAGGVDIVMDGQAMYMKVPGQAGGKYIKMSMQQLEAQGGQNFEKLMNPAENLKMSQQAIQKITYVGEQDVSGAKLKHYSITLDPSKVAGAQPQGATASPSPQQVPYDIWVDGEKLMRKMSMSMQGSKLDMTIDKYGEPVQIQAPPAAQVTQAPVGQDSSTGSGSAKPSPSASK